MQKKYYYILAIIIAIIIGVVVCDQLMFTEKRACEKEGGIWHKYGKICNPATSDVGKECLDSDECEGYCLPELLKEEKEKIDNGEIIYTSGKCGA